MNDLATPSQVKPSTQAELRRVVVIGGGPVGMRFAQELSEKGANTSICVFSNEEVAPYNRARLSLLLAGQTSRSAIDLNAELNEHCDVVNSAVSSIDLSQKLVFDERGEPSKFDDLVFATGARAFVPDIPGKNLPGVFPFRSLRNTESLLARSVKARKLIVVGGGILGVETAVAMLRFNTAVTLVHQSSHLLNRQLDQHAAQRLQDKLEALGIDLRLGIGVRAILGEERCTGVRLRDGSEIDADSVVLCCGSSPNVELARNAGIRINRGIVVDDHLATSEADVYAIGECCEHQEQNYGLIGPGYEQASVLASRFRGEDSRYSGSSPESLLKVLDFPLRSFGDPVHYRRTPFDNEIVYQSASQYLKLVTTRGRLVGGILIGEAEEASAIVDLYQRQDTLPWWRRQCFKLSGRLWPLADQQQASQWQSQRIVCRCRQVNVGAVNSAIELGADSITCLGRELKAGITCGSCQPQLAQLLQAQTGRKTTLLGESLWRSTLLLAFLAMLAVVGFSVIPGLEVGESIQQPAPLQQFWNDKFWKQVSGFTLLGLTVVGLIVSLRKRLPKFQFGQFAKWRFFHVAMGAACIVVLAIHTGLHLGSNLNRWLVVNYLTLLALGALTASAIALSHKLSGRKAQVVRKGWSWLHILAAWPLPALLAVHIASVYRF